jgi:hypothetical protein
MNTDPSPPANQGDPAFAAFLHSKGIDSSRFALAMPEKYKLFEQSFSVAGPTALDYAKKF